MNKVINLSGLVLALLLLACGSGSSNSGTSDTGNLNSVEKVVETTPPAHNAPQNLLPPQDGLATGEKNLESMPTVNEEAKKSALDFDKDTHPSDADCNDQDASIYPNAYEWIGDGINQDCDKKSYKLSYTKQFVGLSCNAIEVQKNQDKGDLENIIDSSNHTIFGKIAVPSSALLVDFLDTTNAVMETSDVVPDSIKRELYYSDLAASQYRMFRIYAMNKDFNGKSTRQEEYAALIYVYNSDNQLVEFNFLKLDKDKYTVYRQLLYAYNPDLTLRYLAEVESELGKVARLRTLYYYNVPEAIKEMIKAKTGYPIGMEYNLSVFSVVTAVKVSYVLASEMYPSFEGSLQDFLNNPPPEIFKTLYQNHLDPKKNNLNYYQKSFTLESGFTLIPLMSIMSAYDAQGQPQMQEIYDLASKKPRLCTQFARESVVE